MSIFLFFYTILIGQSLVVRTSLLSSLLLGRTKGLEPRQAPAIIAASAFLRRAYQACKCFVA